MAGLEITEAGDTCSISNSADAVMPTDTEQQEMGGISRSVPSSLVEVEELVDELHAICREHTRNVTFIDKLVPERLGKRIRKLLSKEGLEELPSGKGLGARLRILEALGLCLQNVEFVTFIDEKLVGEIELSSSEVEALYGKRLASSTALKYLWIRIPGNASEKWEPKSWRLLADILLRAQLLEIDIDDTPLSRLSQLAKAVAASGRGPLTVQGVTLSYGSRDPLGSEETTQSFFEEWGGNVANLNVAAPSVKELQVAIGPFADEDVAELIGEAVASHQSLEVLDITFEGCETLLEVEDSLDADESELCRSRRGRNDESVSSGKKERSPSPACRLLSGAFLRHPFNTSINSFSFSFGSQHIDVDEAKDLQVLCQVLHNHIHITQFALWNLDKVRSRDLRGFFANLQGNGHLQLQSLLLYHRHTQHRPGFGFDPDSFDMLVDLLNSNSMRSLQRLNLSIDSHLEAEDGTKAFDWPRFYASLSRMESVALGGYQQAERGLLDWITGSKVLQILDVDALMGVNWRSVFKSLRENTTLRTLSVPYEALKDDASYRELMGLLQVNSTLQDVRVLGNEGSSREAAVREVLRSKARQESYLAELKRGLAQGRAEWQSPKCGRIFLCGSPEAGPSTSSTI